MMSHLHKIREVCETWFEETPNVTYPKLEGTYLMFPKFDYGMTSEKLVEYLVKDAKVGLDPGTKFGTKGEGHLRILIASSEAIITESLQRISHSLKKL